MMLVVLAYRHDTAASALVERWRAAGERAALLTCADFARRGWVYVAGNPAAGSADIDGQVIATSEIRAVVIRMPAVGEAELGHLHQDDRSYAASEIQALLLAWLSSLQCPVLNRPSPSNLGGPWLSLAQWVQRARRLGIRARPVSERVVFAPDAPPVIERRVDGNSIPVDVVGDRAFLAGGRESGATEVALADAAVSLARDAGVELLRVYFEPGSEHMPVFLEADLWIDVAADRVASAVAERCRELADAGAASRQVTRADGMTATA
jgi:hypothetical protein